MWNLQAIEMLAISLAVCIFVAVILIMINCVTGCYHNCSSRRRKSDVERLPDDYVNEIHRLLHRHKQVMNEYDYPESDDGILTPDAEPLPPLTESLIGTPIKLRSRTNSVKLQKLKEELEEFRVDSPQPPALEELEDRRRTWGGLNDSIFDPVDLPNNSNVEVQTTKTLERMSRSPTAKIETTV